MLKQSHDVDVGEEMYLLRMHGLREDGFEFIKCADLRSVAHEVLEEQRLHLLAQQAQCEADKAAAESAAKANMAAADALYEEEMAAAREVKAVENGENGENGEEASVATEKVDPPAKVAKLR
jgi:hypothetical protein